jgi:hypothetical protein
MESVTFDVIQAFTANEPKLYKSPFELLATISPRGKDTITNICTPGFQCQAGEDFFTVLIKSIRFLLSPIRRREPMNAAGENKVR